MIPKRGKDNFAYEGPWKGSTPGALTTFIKAITRKGLLFPNW